jgi:hypothetical protein
LIFISVGPNRAERSAEFSAPLDNMLGRSELEAIGTDAFIDLELPESQ